MDSSSSQECDYDAESPCDIFDMFPRKRRKRTIIAAEQLLKLENLYKQEQWPGREKKELLAHEIGMSTHFVNIWFQNKRSRVKKLAQEEEEIKALKSKALQITDGSQNGINIAPKLDHEESKSGVRVSASSSSAKPKPLLTATVHPVEPMSVVAPNAPRSPRHTSRYYRSKPVPDAVLSQSPHGTVPRFSQNTIFTTVPISALPSYRLRSKDVASVASLNKNGHVNPAQPRPCPRAIRGRPIPSAQLQQHMTNSIEGKSKLIVLSRRLSSSPCSIDISPTTATGNQAPRSTPSKTKITINAHEIRPCSSLPSPRTIPLATSSKVSRPPIIGRHGIAKRKASTAISPTSLLRCLTLMMAVSECPGTVLPASAEFDLAVCAALYGVRLSNGTLLTYDKSTGFKVEKMEKTKKIKKDKSGKKKKNK